ADARIRGTAGPREPAPQDDHCAHTPSARNRAAAGGREVGQGNRCAARDLGPHGRVAQIQDHGRFGPENERSARAIRHRAGPRDPSVILRIVPSLGIRLNVGMTGSFNESFWRAIMKRFIATVAMLVLGTTAAFAGQSRPREAWRTSPNLDPLVTA